MRPSGHLPGGWPHNLRSTVGDFLVARVARYGGVSRTPKERLCNGTGHRLRRSTLLVTPRCRRRVPSRSPGGMGARDIPWELPANYFRVRGAPFFEGRDHSGSEVVPCAQNHFRKACSHGGSSAVLRAGRWRPRTTPGITTRGGPASRRYRGDWVVLER